VSSPYPETPFHRLDDFLALPRLAGLRLSPDGSRLLTGVAALNPEGTGFSTALWEVDPTGHRPARRLTRGASGEHTAEFTPGGDLLFTAKRPDPEAAEPAKEAPAALWLLPAAGGEARPVGSRPGGIGSVGVAAGSGRVLVTSMTMPGAVTGEDDEQRREARRTRKVSAILHDGYPIRYWDHDLGPDHPRLLVADPDGDGGRLEWRDLTPEPGAALRESHAELSPDGTSVVSEWMEALPHGQARATVVVIDVESRQRRVLLGDDAYEYHSPRISPDGRTVAAIRERVTGPETPPDQKLVLVDLAGGEVRLLTGDWDRWPTTMRWTPDGAALVVTADEQGRGPLFRVSAADGTVLRLTGDDGLYTDPLVSPDGRWVYALRAGVDAPPAPVRLDASTPGQTPEPLPGPAEAPALPGRLVEVHTDADDGTPLRGWLALPRHTGDAGAPLLTWIHGGPLNSWNGWHWRWNPWLAVARGYAVLLPDPALSTGYGLDFVARGWGRWGREPYTDVLALTDAAQAQPGVDRERSAAMGGSFGGYLANWVAGHTDRFDAIVTHASLWALDQFGPTTDSSGYWRREMTPEMIRDNSPHHHVDKITTPMLVIHGDKDYRVPIGEGLRLWSELMARQDDPATQPHRLLYFPDENHWVRGPEHAKLWYETVLAFLDQHVRGLPFILPELLE
jgi:dipeptidyl aminopeptidase/acylaminoacyl peptidase